MAATLLSVLALFGWWLYYRHHSRVCLDQGLTAGCERFVPLERFVCDHDLPATGFLGGCFRLGSRYRAGIGVPKDLRQSIAFLRRACLSRFESRRGDACMFVSFDYADAFGKPHEVINASANYEGPDYAPYWARNPGDVLRQAETLCARDFLGTEFSLARHQYLDMLCGALVAARAATDDARANAPELLRLCDAKNREACHLAGDLLVFGVGVARELERGKALLRRACEMGNSLACEDVGMKGKGPSKLLALLEAAVASEAH